MLKNQCDRCGDYYDIERNHKITINQTSTPQTFDLCNKCNKELIHWLSRNQDFEKGTT